MAALKCKMCGGDIEVTKDLTVGKCLYCGSTMTLPRIDSDRKARLFNRANEYRLNNEFDKAYEAYEAIVEEDEQEAEAYWGMVLSEYGVEYVKDPKTGERVPTCHRTLTQSVVENTNAKLAQNYSSGERRLMYKDEAESLDKLQRQIIAASSGLEPYDAFICYKETDDETGERTQDSLIAENIYEELEKQQVRVFYSRISLEDHLGENYEPYIYAALRSARVMIVVSTKTEHAEAAWVRNEWSRFLKFMDDDAGKVIIPVYREMSPYELPRQLSGFQSQDMSKIGAVQELVRGVKKILGTTRTETRDAKLDALVADQKQREKRKIIHRKIIKVAFVIALLCVLGFLGFLLFEHCRQSYYEKKIQEDVIEVYDEIPNADDYMRMYVEVDKENFDDIFKVVYDDESDYYYLQNKLYDKGWIYVGVYGAKIEVWGTDHGTEVRIRKADEDREATMIPVVSITPINVVFQAFKKDEKIRVLFLSKNAIKKYEFAKELNNSHRYIELLDGFVMEDRGAVAEPY